MEYSSILFKEYNSIVVYSNFYQIFLIKKN